MIRKMDPALEDSGEVEKFDEFVPPSEHKPKARALSTPSRKRPAQAATGSPTSNGSPAAKRPGSAVKKDKAQKPKPVKEPMIVIGIDFGTTYFGVAYAWSGNDQKIDVIMDWDDTNNDHVKVPSAVKFSRDKSEITEWGPNSKDSAGALKWFKLLLVDEDDLPEDVRASAQVQEARTRLHKLGKTPVEVLAMLLEKVWNHCIAKMKAAEGVDTVDTSRFHVVITVPAIWPNYSRDRMRKAVVSAGILRKRVAVGNTTLDFVDEPEAAALATLSSIDGRHEALINESVVIVDCGGGTGDCISYKITNIKPMVLREAATGEGGLCGAIFVDDRFRDLLKKKLEEFSPNAMRGLRERDIRQMITSEWENGIRSQFVGKVNKWVIRLPEKLVDPDMFVDEDDDDDGDYPTFTITSDEVKDVFKPTMERIYALVDRQIQAVFEKTKKLPKHIILVGGFGRCKYLKEYLTPRCRGVEILQKRGSEPWSAICRGAVIHGLTHEKSDSNLTVQVRSRIARASYGIICQEIFDPGKHLEEDRIWDEDQQSDKAGNQFKALIKRGEDILTGRKFRHEFSKTEVDFSGDIITSIWMSKAKNPPTRKDGSLTKLCEVRWTKRIDEEELDVFVNRNGKEFRRMNFTAEMKCSGGAVEVVIVHNGKRQAQENVSVDFQDHGGV
ncbi:hypothetical protein diail_6846 [Diaporthe ilicicola]|nr:hypothetical protein diail_6846 [Diaporthe ilicicola]